MSSGRAPPVAVFRRTRTIEDRHIDALEHVNNVVWVRFVSELADAHSLAVGLDFEAYRALGGFWVVRRHEVHYERSAARGDEILEETWVSEMRGARCLRESRFHSRDRRQRLVRATSLWAFVEPSVQRPRRIPAAVRERFPVPATPPA